MKLHVYPTIKRLAAYSLVAIAAATIVSVSLSSCTRATMPDAEAAKWIAAYPPAHLDMDSKIRIEMTDAMMGKVYTKKKLTDCLDFSPSVKGSTVLSADNRYIDFIPEGSLKQGRKYTCRVKMKELTGVDSLADFKFDFVVDKREMRLVNIVAKVDPDDVSMMTVSGEIQYNVNAGDTITNDLSILECDFPGAKVSVDKTAANKRRKFLITGIKRKAKPFELTVSANPLSGFSKAEEKIDIPAISDFKLINAARIEAAEPYLDLEFSSPLSSRQELDGLITIDRVNDIRIERDGTNIKVYYPQNGITDLTLRVSDLVKNQEGRGLDKEIERHFKQEVIAPAVEMPFDGTILPDNNNLKLPFRAVNLAAVDVEVMKIFPNNVMAFLQENDLDGTHEQRRFGRLIYRKTVRLDKDKTLNLHQWQNFSIDLKGLFRQERGAIYNIRLSFRKAYSLYDKSEPEAFEEVAGLTAEDTETWDDDCPYIVRDAPDNNWDEYEWKEIDDPTKPSYYMEESRMPEKNLVASNLGLIVKCGEDNKYHTVVTNLLTASPASNIEVTAYNYQLQKMASGRTDANGFLTIKTDSKPFIFTASDGKSTTYVKVTGWQELSTSNFDVSGKKIKDGVKGFAYGDRGVWRPGDVLHLSLVIEDKQKNLPKNHPVVLELYNPSEQLYARKTLTEGVDGFYVFHVPTDENVPTGLWDARFKVGNQTFHHKVRIETIKPNRLKINLSTPEVIQANSPQMIGLDARWLTGPVAKDMAATLEMTLYSDSKPFEGYKKYVFSNPLVTYSSSQKQVLSGRLDSVGSLKKTCTIGTDQNAPGMLRANLTAKVTEPGGDASITSRSVQFSPFGVYVGIDLAATDYQTDKDLSFPVVVVNQKGMRMKTRDLEYKIYRLDWDWWWEGSAQDLSRYVKSTSADLVESGVVTATNGFASVPFRVNYPDWGKYLVLVRDTKGGHATGGTIRVDWPDWRGRADKGEASGSTELSFTLDKKVYEAGETANVYLPKCRGRVLVSVENGTGVIKKYWVNTSADKETCFKLPVDGAMAPNFYVSATLLRPHGETQNDVAMRLYGVVGASVIDKRTILNPQIEMPDEIHPQQQFVIKVKERNNKPMTYTLAIVDEGLLDITNFKTPRPWAAMYQREALGVKTWDMFDDVIGAFGARFRPILSIGGDEALRTSAGKEKRFNPVVKFLGPVTLHGGTNTHKITLPNYVGSVRVMIVAAHQGSYGSVDKTAKVTSPLMLLTTLPRTLACGDAVEMPVNVFAMADDINDASVNVETMGPVSVSGTKSRTLKFGKEDEKMVDFKLVCSKTEEGPARIIVSAVSGGRRMSDTTFIDVKNPMPVIINTTQRTLKSGESTTFDWGNVNAESVNLQISSMPAFNFGGSMAYFESYPHLCTEQLSSKALFMLFGRRYLKQEDKEKCEVQLPTVIKYILSRQLTDGGFAYWPGMAEANTWVTSMAGIVMEEASRQGFNVGSNVMDKWFEYQEKTARDYRYSEKTDLDQAYRLYSMAKAGRSMKSAMNRLRESKKMSQTAAYCLASAYAIDGRVDVAAKLIERAERTPYSASKGMFQSQVRDEAIKMEAYALCKLSGMATPVARTLAAQCSGSRYVTQDIAFATIAMQALDELVGASEASVLVTRNGDTPISIQNLNGVRNMPLEVSMCSTTITNKGRGDVDLSLATAVRLSVSDKVGAQNHGLAISVSYTDLAGKPLMISKLKQDAEFNARVTVTNQGNDIKAMAMTYKIPSGWEIWNTRLLGDLGKSIDHCDIRDDKISFYSSLAAGKKITYTIRLRAAYVGEYSLPSVVCEDMYNPSCRAIAANSWVSVVK